jgi:uncharacterized protein (TIGR02996 family)
MTDTHPELARLLAGLHDDPADDALWLVVADWLEENGEEDRAELVRLNRALRGVRLDKDRLPLEARLRKLVRGRVRPCVPGIANSIGMRLVLIPAGTFRIGSPDDEKGRYASEGPRHQREIAHPFWMGVGPVTQAEYEAVAGRNPSAFAPTGAAADRVKGLDTGVLPVECLTWEDAAAFCAALSGLPAEKTAGRVYRLPSETEWEYACRAGTTSAFHFGSQLFKAHANLKAAGLGRTSVAGAYPANAWGLYDMHGNVWEWCLDWFGEDIYGGGPTAPTPAEGPGRVLRGGSWDFDASACRSATRGFGHPVPSRHDWGFRVVCEITPRGAGK